MVKRQTVWLSTMMVLSLMLIGYYTMNSGSQTASTNTSSPSVTTTTVGPQSSNSTSSTGKPTTNTTGSGNHGSSSASSTPSTPTKGTDWFTNYQTDVEQQIAKEEGAAQQVIGNSNSSTQAINQAQQQLRHYMNLDGAMMQARQAILGEGYNNCVIVPNQSGTGVQVYVEAKTLSAPEAVKVMNIVSQQLNIPINSVIVHRHA